MSFGVDIGGTDTDDVLIDGATVVACVTAPTTADADLGLAGAIESALAQPAIASGAAAGVMINPPSLPTRPPFAYLPGAACQIRIKAVGDLAKG